MSAAIAPTHRDRRSQWAVAVALAIAALAAYSNSLHVPFVFDDALAISDNPTIRDLWPISKVLLPQGEGGLTVSGRPVLNLSFALNYAMSGPAVWGYHLFNLLSHVGSGLLLFGIVRRTLERRPRLSGLLFASSDKEKSIRFAANGNSVNTAVLAVVIAALWMLHPLHTQAVTYTVQRAESLMGLFYLLTLYAFVRSVDAAQPVRWLTLSITACLLGMGTKEVMATAPLIVLLYDRTFTAGSFREAWRRNRFFYSALAATWLVLGALVLSTGGNRGGTAGLGVAVPWWAYGLTQFQAVTRYLALSAWPHPLVFEYGTFWVLRGSDIVPYAAVVLPLLAGTLLALWRNPVVGFCGAWFFLILAPSSLTPGTIQMIVEHRMYLPLAAPTVLLMVFFERSLGRRVLFSTAMIAIALAGLTYRRNDDYRSHLALWKDTVSKRPDNPRAEQNLAEAFSELGRREEAIEHYAEAVRLRPGDPIHHYNLGLALADAGRFAEAIRHYQLSLHLAPNEANTHNNLAVALVKSGDPAAALPHNAEAARLKPASALFHYNYGLALLGANRFAEGVGEFSAALDLEPAYADAHFNLGFALARLNRFDEALLHHDAAVRLRPGDVEFQAGRGDTLLFAGRPQDAIAQFRAVLSTHLDAVDARLGLGNALAATNQFSEAVSQYEAVLRLSPNHTEAHFKLGNVLMETDRVPLAIQHYESAVRLKPDDAEGHHNLGAAYARLERWNDAGREFEAALRLRPDYTAARQHLDQLRALIREGAATRPRN